MANDPTLKISNSSVRDDSGATFGDYMEGNTNTVTLARSPALKAWGGTEAEPALEIPEDGQLIVGQWSLRQLLRYWWNSNRRL